MALCDNTTLVVAWELGEGDGAPLYGGACVVAEPCATFSSVGSDIRVYSRGPLFFNATSHALVGVGVPPTGAARTAKVISAVPSCDVAAVSVLDVDAHPVTDTDYPGLFALDSSTDPSFPPLLLYQTLGPSFNLTAWSPATGALELFVPHVETAGIYENMGGPLPPMLSVYRRHVINAGDFYNGRMGVDYYAHGDISNVTAAASTFRIVRDTWTFQPPLSIYPLFPAQLSGDSTGGTLILRLTQSYGPLGSGDFPRCIDTGSANGSSIVAVLTPAADAPNGFDLVTTTVSLSTCPLPPPGVCLSIATAHWWPVAARQL